MTADAPAPAPPARTWRNRLRRLAVRAARVAVVLYLGVAVVLYALQTAMIFPGAQTQGTAAAQIPHVPPGAELVRLTAATGEPVAALFGPALGRAGDPGGGPARGPALVYFYGNAMCLADCLDRFDELRRRGFDVIIPDYLGYGLSGGKPGADGCRAAADAALAHLLARPGVDRSRVVAAGWSLGGAVALDLAARHPGEVAGVATFSAFTSLADMARRVAPFLPASLLLRHRLDNRARVAELSVPILIGHGRADRIIPFAMADELAAAARGPVERVSVDGADHNDFFLVGGDAVLDRLRAFAAGLPAKGGPQP